MIPSERIHGSGLLPLPVAAAIAYDNLASHLQAARTTEQLHDRLDGAAVALASLAPIYRTDGDEPLVVAESALATGRFTDGAETLRFSDGSAHDCGHRRLCSDARSPCTRDWRHDVLARHKRSRAVLICGRGRIMSTGETRASAAPQIESISAVTLATHDMARAIRFYSALGFSIRTGGVSAGFTSLRAGQCYLNLIGAPANQRWSWWGRLIIPTSDVDGMYRHAVAQGLQPQFAPRDAEWGEHYFHCVSN